MDDALTHGQRLAAETGHLQPVSRAEGIFTRRRCYVQQQAAKSCCSTPYEVCTLNSNNTVSAICIKNHSISLDVPFQKEHKFNNAANASGWHPSAQHINCRQVLNSVKLLAYLGSFMTAMNIITAGNGWALQKYNTKITVCYSTSMRTLRSYCVNKCEVT